MGLAANHQGKGFCLAGTPAVATTERGEQENHNPLVRYGDDDAAPGDDCRASNPRPGGPPLWFWICDEKNRIWSEAENPRRGAPLLILIL